jgi:hypothetical protein
MKSILFLLVVSIGIPAYAADAQSKTTKKSPPSAAAVESMKREQAVKAAREKRMREDSREENRAMKKGKQAPAEPPMEVDNFDKAVSDKIKKIQELMYKAAHAKSEAEAKLYRDQAAQERRNLEMLPRSAPKRKK